MKVRSNWADDPEHIYMKMGLEFPRGIRRYFDFVSSARSIACRMKRW